MLLASISIISPAISRMWRWVPQWSGLGSTTALSTSMTPGVLLLLLAGLALNDRISLKRIHPATLFGGHFFIAVRLIATFVIADSEFGQSFVNGLE